MSEKSYKELADEAITNSAKNPLELKAGDMIIAVKGGENCNNIADWLKEKQQKYGNPDYMDLCKIDSIVKFPAGYNLLGGWLYRAAIERTESDTAQYKTVTMIRKDSGEWIAISGRKYWDVVYMPANYKTMFNL